MQQGISTALSAAFSPLSPNGPASPRTTFIMRNVMGEHPAHYLQRIKNIIAVFRTIKGSLNQLPTMQNEWLNGIAHFTQWVQALLLGIPGSPLSWGLCWAPMPSALTERSCLVLTAQGTGHRTQGVVPGYGAGRTHTWVLRRGQECRPHRGRVQLRDSCCPKPAMGHCSNVGPGSQILQLSRKLARNQDFYEKYFL